MAKVELSKAYPNYTYKNSNKESKCKTFCLSLTIKKVLAKYFPVILYREAIYFKCLFVNFRLFQVCDFDNFIIVLVSNTARPDSTHNP